MNADIILCGMIGSAVIIISMCLAVYLWKKLFWVGIAALFGSFYYICYQACEQEVVVSLMVFFILFVGSLVSYLTIGEMKKTQRQRVRNRRRLLLLPAVFSYWWRSQK